MEEDANSTEDEQPQNGRYKKRPKLSKVWEHFTLKSKKNVVVCKHCKMELAYYNSTSAMLQHIKRKHEQQETSKPSEPEEGPPCSPVQAAVLTDSVLNMLVTDMHPLSMVDDVGFKAMIATFQPNYVLPSRTYFTKRLEEKFEELRGKIKAAQQEAGSVDLTVICKQEDCT